MGDVIEAVRETALFRDLSDAELEEARASIQPWRFADGEALMVQGAASDGAYVIVEGRVAVSARLPGGGEALVSDLGPGDLIGERKKGDSHTASTPSPAIWSSRPSSPGRSPTPSPSASAKLRG